MEITETQYRQIQGCLLGLYQLLLQRFQRIATAQNNVLVGMISPKARDQLGADRPDVTIDTRANAGIPEIHDGAGA